MNIGAILGISDFEDAQLELMHEHRRALNRAYTRERKDASRLIAAQELARGREDPALAHTPSSEALRVWMRDIRMAYRGKVLRRTVDSVDDKGEAILGIPPAFDAVMMVTLNSRETKTISKLARRLGKDTTEDRTYQVSIKSLRTSQWQRGETSGDQVVFTTG